MINNLNFKLDLSPQNIILIGTVAALSAFMVTKYFLSQSTFFKLKRIKLFKKI